MNVRFSLMRPSALVALALSLVLTACGGGGSSSGTSTTTGKFVDATVVGMPYKCGTSSTVSGTTDATGQFTCATGQAVAFYVGDILIGSVSSPSAVVTPLDIIGSGATPSHTTVANIVRFFMSISSTNPTTGTITIDSTVNTAALGKTADFTAPTAPVLDALITTVKPGATVYTSAQAATHVSDSLNGLFAGSYSGSYGGTSSGNWSVTINNVGAVNGNSAAAGIIVGNMATTLSTGSTYTFTGTAGGVPWTGTLNISTRVFKGTWNDGAGHSGTWTNL